MKIEFDEMAETLIPEFKGGTGELFLKKYEEDKIKNNKEDKEKRRRLFHREA